MSSANIIALVPLRGGSKSIPGKNIKPMAGKPLCMHAIEAAHHSGIFSKIIVSTDSEIIADIVRYSGIPLEVSMRPAELATDNASTESVMLYIAEQYDFDIMCTIQVTSPLVQENDFIAAWKQFEFEQLDSLATGVLVKRFFWNKEGRPINYNPAQRPMRQNFEGWMMENGAFYFTKKGLLQAGKCRLGGKIGIYEMAEETALEIDEPSDWEFVELQLRKRQGSVYKSTIEQIKVLISDVDGTLTDAGMYYSAEGEQLKKFNTRDAKGLELIRDLLGIRIVILTRENSAIVSARAKKLKIDDCYIGILDKPSFLKKFCEDNKLSMSNIAYIGDDLNDLECMSEVGFPACPSNAEKEIRKVSKYVAKEKGGEGAVREICNLMLEIMQKV